MTNLSIDKKYQAQVFKHDGTMVEDYIIFRAKDKCVPAMLDAYYNECKIWGADPFHLGIIRQLKDRVCEFQYNNPEKCKVPDTKPEEIRD